jgi:hypothetical protein
MVSGLRFCRSVLCRPARGVLAFDPKSHHFRDGCKSKIRSSWLQKSPGPNSRKRGEIPLTFQRAIFIWECASSILPGQPGIPAFGRPSQETRKWAGNPGFSRIRFRLQARSSPNSRWKSPKVSSLVREYSRFAETIGGDRLDHDCRLNHGTQPRSALPSGLYEKEVRRPIAERLYCEFESLSLRHQTSSPCSPR